MARGRILVGDGAAREAGIEVGQKLSTALGLAPGLVVFERNEAQEQAMLASLACWAGRFTPQVVLVPPATLLLEIGGCRRLFGNIQALVAMALASCREQGLSIAWAVAPTPLSASWLAWGGASAIFDEGDPWPAALGRLPVAVAGWPPPVLSRLQSFGLEILEDLRRLPATGLRQRLGEAVMNELLQAWGELPDPRRPFDFPESFAQGLELPCRVDHAEALLFASRRLFAALAGWLNGRRLALRAGCLLLRHEDGSRSTVSLRLAEASADEERLVRLLREHLSRLVLAAPVEAITLQAEDVSLLETGNGDLFHRPPAGDGVMACLERLRGRLGDEAVQVLAVVPDYRPECASRHLAPGERKITVDIAVDRGQGARPLWLLPVPEALAESNGRPVWHGPLALLTRPERLESGWWDADEADAVGDVRRDYCVASNPRGQTLWIYRDAGGWFLHGVFP